MIATHNPGKLREFQSLLAPLGWQAVGAGEHGLAETEETAPDFAGNAQLKARVAAQVSGLPALADDSGLCVAALAGAPGVFSARYAAGDYPTAFARIIAACAAAAEWRAWFTCALCWAEPDGSTATYIGQVHGVIAKSPSGAGGFGYDPIFVPEGFEASFAALDPKVKDAVSHRRRAFEQIRAKL